MLLTARHWSSSCTVLSYLVGLSLLLAYGERFSFQGERASINSLQLILIVNFSMSYAAQKWARKLEKENKKEMDDEGVKKIGKTKLKGRVQEEKVLGIREFNATAELGQDTKRETARNRGFDQRVSNISSIQDKISSLLGMIKKDKVEESVENHMEKTYNPIHPVHLHRNEAMVNFSKDDTSQREKYHHQPKENLSYADLKPKKYESSNRYVNLQPKASLRSYNMPVPRNYNQPIQRKPREQPAKEVKKDKPKRRYLPQEDTLRETYRREKSAANTSRYHIQESFQETSRYDIKIQRKNQCKTPKARTRLPQEKPSFLVHQGHKTSPAVDIQSRFQKIVVESPIDRVTSKQSIHQIYQIQQQDSFVLQSHIPKPQYSKFMPIAELPTIAPKLNTTTQLIDQQLRRMRCKIQEKQSHTNRFQKPSQLL